MKKAKQPVIVLVGPTAVGKTKLSIEIAKAFNGEIISGDSMQIYKGMDIGTAKITPEEMDGVPHHLIDIKQPEDSFSTAEFQQLVRLKIDEIAARGKTPMIVGGTGLYIQSVLYDYTFTEEKSDPVYRDEMTLYAQKHGALELYEKLKAVDPDAAKSIHPNNVRRVIRALEVIHTTGKKMSEMKNGDQEIPLYETALIGLKMDRELLYERIHQRIDMMLDEGLVEEVKALYQSGLKDCQSVQAIGYKELYAYFEGDCTLDEAIEQLKQNSRRYAKRQLTWFRNKMDVTWFDMTPPCHFSDKKVEIFAYIAGKLGLKAKL
ncbi:tRNA (adenosine(37)-N6)-dimethylallyltransferase MiaA [Bacillus sp. 179-C3.3 HS]|uniref:tRNA (adenosine(37)-N6)-dimethylallyltransferase MiaA n=1 Tax=Bacillus sp. 179-C3.3 HS TaxID=3232162 RepID=UPI00399F7620